MRFLVGLLLTLVWLPSGGAPDRTAYLAAAAGVPIQIFDLQAPDVSQRFRLFLSEVPMTNDRPLPAALVDDTAASLSFVKAMTPVDAPSYFVATYIQKTPLMTVAPADRERYMLRYGEAVFPQQVCPVFLSRADAGVSRLLSTAVNLPDAYFAKVAGSAENFDRLFALTEASHCGFIARELANPTVLPAGLSQKQVRTILEALGDFEATAVFRGGPGLGGGAPGADEADVLSAARLLATFLLDRRNPYTPLPGLMLEYERIGVDAAHRDIDRISSSVMLARRTVRKALQVSGAPPSLEAVVAGLGQAHDRGALDLDDELATELIAGLVPAINLILGNTAYAPPARRPAEPGAGGASRLVTLTAGSIPR